MARHWTGSRSNVSSATSFADLRPKSVGFVATYRREKWPSTGGRFAIEGKANRSLCQRDCRSKKRKEPEKKRHSFTVRCCGARIHATLSQLLTTESPSSYVDRDFLLLPLFFVYIVQSLLSRRIDLRYFTLLGRSTFTKKHSSFRPRFANTRSFNAHAGDTYGRQSRFLRSVVLAVIDVTFAKRTKLRTSISVKNTRLRLLNARLLKPKREKERERGRKESGEAM